MTKNTQTAIIPSDDAPNRAPDGYVDGANGQQFFYWLGAEADTDGWDEDDEYEGVEEGPADVGFVDESASGERDDER